MKKKKKYYSAKVDWTNEDSWTLDKHGFAEPTYKYPHIASMTIKKVDPVLTIQIIGDTIHIDYVP